jgi:hypothetical protein
MSKRNLRDGVVAQADVRDTIDERLAVLWGHVQTREAAFLSGRGRYFQGLRTPVLTPVDGGERVPDSTRKPTDQAQSWADAGFSLPATMPMSLEIHTYDGPGGKGYVAVVEVEFNGRIWRRAQQHGAETWRSHGWRQLPVERGG